MRPEMLGLDGFVSAKPEKIAVPSAHKHAKRILQRFTRMSEITMLRQCDLSKPPPHTVTDYAIQYNFPLDIFQEHAISAIDQGHNILVCAKTGSGKTLCYLIPILNELASQKR